MFVRSLIHLMWLKAVTCARSVQVILIGDLVKQVRTPPVRPADGVVGCVYESFVLGEDCRGLGLRADLVAATKSFRVREARYIQCSLLKE